MIVWLKKASSTKMLKCLLTLQILTLFSGLVNAGQATIATNKSLSTTFRIDSIFYAHSSIDMDVTLYSLGIGKKFDHFEFALTVGLEDKTEVAILHVNYFDKKIMVFGSVLGELNRAKYKLKLGAGYPLNEKVSAVTFYENDALHLGLRRIF